MLHKTHKTFKWLHYDNACSSIELDIHKRQIDQLQNKRRKKVAIDQNSCFLDIEDIKRAQEEIQRRWVEFERRDAQKEAAEASRAVMEKDMEQFMSVFDLFEAN